MPSSSASQFPATPPPVPSNRPAPDPPPTRPDWLLIMMVALFILAISIAWYVW